MLLHTEYIHIYMSNEEDALHVTFVLPLNFEQKSKKRKGPITPPLILTEGDSESESPHTSNDDNSENKKNKQKIWNVQ